MKRGLKRFYEYKERFEGILAQTKSAPDPNPMDVGFFELVVTLINETIYAAENDKPLVSIWYGNAPEIFAAMDIYTEGPVDLVLANIPFTDYIEKSHETPTPPDSCGLIRLAAMAVENGELPTPKAIIPMLEPCDTQSTVHEAAMKVEEWCDAPVFALDPPYGSSDEDWEYFAGELERMISFLEDLFNTKIDYGRLKEVIDETNRLYAVWDEVNELLEAVPCPLPSLLAGDQGWFVAQHTRSGTKEATEWFKTARDVAEANVAAGMGAVPGEQIRMLLTDNNPTWLPHLAPWLAEKWGCNIVMSWQGLAGYTMIDTSTKESMLKGLARRALNEVPMMRQSRGNLHNFLEDVRTCVNNYHLNAVWLPGHKGHKDQSGNIGFLRDLCVELNVPLLVTNCDVFDPTYTSIESLKRSFDEFFAAYGYKPLK